MTIGEARPEPNRSERVRASDPDLARRLRRRWSLLVPGGEHLDPSRGPVAAMVGDDLVRRWSAPLRRYHDLRHLAEVLDRLRTLPAGGSTTVRLAAWFHDAVYEPTADPGASEAASAALAESLLPASGLDSGRVAEVARLVLLTRDHQVAPDDRTGAALVDADLAVLAATPERYLDYAAGVRAEYAHLCDRVFRRGRSAVLHGLLGRESIFTTPAGRQRWEAGARANMAVELRMLDAG